MSKLLLTKEEKRSIIKDILVSIEHGRWVLPYICTWVVKEIGHRRVTHRYREQRISFYWPEFIPFITEWGQHFQQMYCINRHRPPYCWTQPFFQDTLLTTKEQQHLRIDVLHNALEKIINDEL